MNKWSLGLILVLAFGALFFGTTLLFPHLFTKESEKAEIKYETGDRPLPQKVDVWIVADGGLFMRENADSKSQIISIIPNGTKLTAEETLGEWYKVNYQGKTGWINKSYTTNQAPAENPTNSWQTYQNKAVGYSLRYPTEWVAQDYGANPATGSESYVGIGAQLPASLDPSRLPPIVVRTSKKSLADVESEFSKQSNVITEAVSISGVAGKKFTYNASSGVQMTTCVIGKGSTVFIFEETGGFSDEFMKIIGTVIFS